MTVEPYQNLVIGSGEGGKLLAWNLAKQGQKTAVAERSMVGGFCPNVACLPSKNVIYMPRPFPWRIAPVCRPARRPRGATIRGNMSFDRNASAKETRK